MKIFSNISEVANSIVKPVFTTGTFDGVHLGHQKILSQVNSLANSIAGESLVLTFWPHPRMVLQTGAAPISLLSTEEEKIELLEKAGVQNLIIHPFTREFAQLSYQQFIAEVGKYIDPKIFVVGHDHQFGKNREGNFELLQELAIGKNFSVVEIPPKDIDNIAISSTKIRQALQNGDVKLARQYLAHPYTAKGLVVHGDKIGAKIGFPTANLQIDKHKLLPANGVYAVYVQHHAQQYMGMMNLGNRPTVNGVEFRAEVNLLNFDGDLYGETLQVEFVEKMRDEKKFNGLDELKKQLSLDQQSALNILA